MCLTPGIAHVGLPPGSCIGLSAALGLDKPAAQRCVPEPASQGVSVTFFGGTTSTVATNRYAAENVTNPPLDSLTSTSQQTPGRPLGPQLTLPAQH